MNENKEVMTDKELMRLCIADAVSLDKSVSCEVVTTLARTLFEHRACKVDVRWEREGVESAPVDASVQASEIQSLKAQLKNARVHNHVIRSKTLAEVRAAVKVWASENAATGDRNRGRHKGYNDVLEKLDELEGK